MARSMGVVPDFNDIDESHAHSLLTTGSEVMRMLRDGDGDSTDERARSIYASLITRN